MSRDVKLLTRVYVSQFLLSVLRTGFDSAIFARRPIRHNGGNEDPKVKFTCIVLTHYHKAWNGTREEVKKKASSQRIRYIALSSFILHQVHNNVHFNKLTKTQFLIFLQGHTDYLSLRWGPGWCINCRACVLDMGNGSLQIHFHIFYTLLVKGRANLHLWMTWNFQITQSACLWIVE